MKVGVSRTAEVSLENPQTFSWWSFAFRDSGSSGEPGSGVVGSTAIGAGM